VAAKSSRNNLRSIPQLLSSASTASAPTARRKSFGLARRCCLRSRTRFRRPPPRWTGNSGALLAVDGHGVFAHLAKFRLGANLRASHAIPRQDFLCTANPGKFILSGLITKPKARSNPTPSTHNFSQSGAASSGGVLPRPRAQEHRLIRITCE